MGILNFFMDYIRRYGKSKRYRLSYNPTVKSLRVWYNGLLMENKKDYNYNRKLNTIDFNFLPIKKTKIIIEGLLKK